MRWDELAALSRDTDVRGVWHSWTYYVWCFIANVRAVFVLLREKLCPRTKRQCPFVQCDIKASTVALGETVRKLPCHRERKQNHKKEKKKNKKIKKEKKKQNHTQQQKNPTRRNKKRLKRATEGPPCRTDPRVVADVGHHPGFCPWAQVLFAKDAQNATCQLY